MKNRFTSDDAERLIEIAVRKPDAEIVRLALKAAKVTKVSVSERVISAVQKADLSAWILENVLARVAEYEGLNFVLTALRSDHLRFRDAAIHALRILSNEKSSAVLEQMLDDPTNHHLRQLVAQTARTECKPLGLLNEQDYMLAEALLDREFISAELPYLVRKLASSNVDVRRQAVNRLLKMGPIADQFYTALDNAVVNPSKELLELLGRLEDPRQSTYIVKLLNAIYTNRTYADWKVIEDAIQLLTKADDVAITYLMDKVLSNPDSSFRELHALEEIGAAVVPHVLRAYASHEVCRRSGGRILVKLAGAEAVPFLIASLQDRLRQVRHDAELALVALGSVAVKPLITLLDHSDTDVRRHACRALGRIGDGRAFEGLVRVSFSGNRQEQWDAVEALVGIQDSHAITELSQWLQSPQWDTRRRIAKALSKAHNKDAVLLLVQISTDEDRRVRLEAIRSIANHFSSNQSRQTNLFEALVAATGDADAEIAMIAKAGLQESEPKVSGLQEIETEDERWWMPGRARLVASAPRPPPPLTPDIPRPVTDNLHFTVTAPRVVGKLDWFVLDVWAHFGSRREDIFKRAKEEYGDRGVHIRSRGPVPVKRHTTLRVLLSIPTFGIEHSEDEIHWAGETGNCTFPVHVPAYVSQGFYVGTAKFFVEGLQVSKLSFDIEVGQKNAERSDVTTREDKVKTAFASYASEERNKVTARIQGMLKIIPELDIFLDVASLRSGENWRKRLEQEIVSRDVLYLFWSRAASNSEWVEVEWRTALANRGLDHIDPVPLEPANVTPPPPELATLHFNEWTLAFERGDLDH